MEALKYITRKTPTTTSKTNTPCVLQTDQSALHCNKNNLPVPPYGTNNKMGAQKNKNLTVEGAKAAMWVNNIASIFGGFFIFLHSQLRRGLGRSLYFCQYEF